ncbi:MAG: TraR/DksA C4-type zinc finger protein [Anaerolineae bacterium]|jgi:RNA polymerase-binding transcription factor DksA
MSEMVVEKKRDEARELQRELEELREQIAALEVALEQKPDYGMGKGDPSITRWELDRAMLGELQERAASLRRQLSRISQGTYGICDRCGKRIDPDRLAVLPDTEICIECARSGQR